MKILLPYRDRTLIYVRFPIRPAIDFRHHNTASNTMKPVCGSCVACDITKYMRTGVYGSGVKLLASPIVLIGDGITIF